MLVQAAMKQKQLIRQVLKRYFGVKGTPVYMLDLACFDHPEEYVWPSFHHLFMLRSSIAHLVYRNACRDKQARSMRYSGMCWSVCASTSCVIARPLLYSSRRAPLHGMALGHSLPARQTTQ